MSQLTKFDLTFQISPFPLLLVARDGTISRANVKFHALFGYDPGELIGHPVEILVPPRGRHKHGALMDAFHQAPANRTMGMGRELEGLTKSGQLIPLEVGLEVVPHDTGTLTLVVAFDTRPRMRQEHILKTSKDAATKAMAEKNVELALLNDELSHFAYSASHDLKAPLSSITGLLGLCLEDLDDGNLTEVRDNIAKVINISKRSATKVEGILAIARAGRNPVPPEVIPLGPMINDIWADLIGAKTTTKLTLALHDIATVFTERPTLRVILENLLSNALRYADPQKPFHEVQVHSALHSEHLQICVHDNGVGIQTAKQHKVFSMFVRLDERSGDGLGLALVQKQVDRLGGTIRFESQEGKGTTFTVSLPRKGPHYG